MYTFDLRGHGESGRPNWASEVLPPEPSIAYVVLLASLDQVPPWIAVPAHKSSLLYTLQGLRIARLAADLRDLLTELDLQDVTVVGTRWGLDCDEDHPTFWVAVVGT